MKKIVSGMLSLLICFATLIGAHGLSLERTVDLCAYESLGDISPYTVKNDLQYEAVLYVFDCLYFIDDDGRARPMLSDNIQISDDRKTYQVTLKEGVLWHDGTKLTVDDVVYTFNNAKNVEWFKFAVRSVETVRGEGNNIIFTLKYPNSDFVKEAISYVPIVPKAYYEKGDFKPIGSGAYKVTKDNENKYTFRENHEYYNKDATALVSSITVDILAGEQECVTAFNEGKYAAIFGNISVSSFNQIDENYKEKEEIYGLNTQVLFFNNENPKLQNPNTRKAIAMAIDYDKIKKEVYGGKADRGSWGFYCPMVDFHNKEQNAFTNVDEAKQMVAGGQNEVSLTILTAEGKQELLANAVKEGMEKLGIKAQIVVKNGEEIQKALADGSYECAVVELSKYYQLSENNLELLLNKNYNNYSRYSSAEMDRLFAEFKNCEKPEDRYNSLMAIQRQLTWDMPFVTLAYPKILGAYEQLKYKHFVFKEGVGIYSYLSFKENRKSLAAKGNQEFLAGPDKGSINFWQAGTIVIGFLAIAFCVYYAVSKRKEKK